MAEQRNEYKALQKRHVMQSSTEMYWLHCNGTSPALRSCDKRIWLPESQFGWKIKKTCDKSSSCPPRSLLVEFWKVYWIIFFFLSFFLDMLHPTSTLLFISYHFKKGNKDIFKQEIKKTPIFSRTKGGTLTDGTNGKFLKIAPMKTRLLCLVQRWETLLILT